MAKPTGYQRPEVTALPSSSTSSYRLPNSCLSSGCWTAQTAAAMAPLAAPRNVVARSSGAELLTATTVTTPAPAGNSKCGGSRSPSSTRAGSWRQPDRLRDRPGQLSDLLPDLFPDAADRA